MNKNALRHAEFSIESLEARALLSADLGSGIQFDPATAVNLVGQAEVADADFMNPAGWDLPDTSETADAGDEEMYDFGDSWGTNPEIATQDNVEIFPDDIDNAEFGGRPGRTPSDVSATQNGTHEESLALRDSTDEDVPQDPAASPDDIELDDAPVAAPIAGTSPEAVWINFPSTAEWISSIDSVVHADVVIESAFA